MLRQRLCSYTCLNEASYVSPQSPSWIRLSGSLENNNFQQGTQVKIKILLVQGRHYEMPTNTKKWKVFLSTLESGWRGLPLITQPHNPAWESYPERERQNPGTLRLQCCTPGGACEWGVTKGHALRSSTALSPFASFLPLPGILLTNLYLKSKNNSNKTKTRFLPL